MFYNGYAFHFSNKEQFVNATILISQRKIEIGASTILIDCILREITVSIICSDRKFSRKINGATRKLLRFNWFSAFHSKCSVYKLSAAMLLTMFVICYKAYSISLHDLHSFLFRSLIPICIQYLSSRSTHLADSSFISLFLLHSWSMYV
jgi:hypothetical protein